MTDAAKVRRRATALALIPATAGIFGVSVAWASSHDPFTAAGSTAAPAAAGPAVPATTPDPQTTVDPQVADLTAKISQAQERLAQLQATFDAQAGGAAAPAGASAAAPATAAKPAAPAAPKPAAAAAPKPAAAAAPKPAPAVHAVTKASGV
jgi:hypothetical protein